MPFENPTGLSNFIEMFLILCIPTSLTYTYGRMVGSRRQGWAVFAAMAVLFVGAVAVVYTAEQHGTVAQHLAGVHTHQLAGSTGGNLEGKEQRFGIANSSLFAAVTTVTSCGAVNASFESLTGIGGLVPFADLSASETIFGGVGTGLYSMLLMVILAVFIGGLMVGRTPEYLGKKIEAREIKLTSIGILFTPIAVLIASALALGTKYGKPSIYASGPQGFSEIAVRLPVAGQQQRLGVRRLHRLRPAQRRQPRLPRRDVRRPDRRPDDDDRALRADPDRARRRRLAGDQEGHSRPASARCAPTRRRSSSCCSASSSSSAR